MPVPDRPTAPRAREASPTIRRARRRADRAKVFAVAFALALFAGGIGLTRGSYASHHKQASHALAAPTRFERIVQSDTLGVVAPEQAPAAAQTATS